jgi:hypothetical protein
MADKRCGAPLRKKPGKRCRCRPLVGATRCVLHGGKQQILPEGHPARGGRPPTDGLYAKYLPRDMIDDFGNADVGNLEGLIRLKKAFLAKAIRRLEEHSSPDGIYESVEIETERKDGRSRRRRRSPLDVVNILTEEVRQLELAQRKLAESMLGDADSLLDLVNESMQEDADGTDTQ